MTFKALDFKCALVTGGAGGLGKAMALHFLEIGKEVIICGRTETKLKETVDEIGHDRLSYYLLDTSDIAAIPAFVTRITSEHPDLDCLVNNAGVQRPLEVGKMDADEFLSKADQEIDIDIRGPMHLALRLLPHFKSKPGAVIMNVSSMLGYIPTSVINPVYNGAKAWLHFFTMNLRTQLQQSGSNVRVVEIAPPQVATDLHRERDDPDDNKKGKSAVTMSIDEFMRDVVRQWDEDRDTVAAGPSIDIVRRWYDTFGPDYDKAAGKR